MRAVIQRVSKGKVQVDGDTVGEIGPGMVVLLGIAENDTEEDLNYLAEKIINLRIFPDEEGKMNLSVKDTRGGVLVVSQFTLYGDCRKGRRPSFTRAALPDRAEKLYSGFIKAVEDNGLHVASGEFQAMMEVQIYNDGPVTLLLDSKKQF